MEDLKKVENTVNSVDAFIYWKDAEGVMLGGNKAILEAFGKDMIGKKNSDYFTDTEFGAWIEKIDHQVISTGQAVLNIHESGQDDQGNPVRVISNKYPIKDANGKTIGLFGVTTPDLHAKPGEPKFYIKE